jgi:hypothetical protein
MQNLASTVAGSLTAQSSLTGVLLHGHFALPPRALAFHRGT